MSGGGADRLAGPEHLELHGYIKEFGLYSKSNRKPLEELELGREVL